MIRIQTIAMVLDNFDMIYLSIYRHPRLFTRPTRVPIDNIIHMEIVRRILIIIMVPVSANLQ